MTTPPAPSAEPQPRLLPRAIIIAVLVLLAVVGYWQLRIDSSLEPLLPQTSEARKMLNFLRDSTFSNKAVLWLRLTEEEVEPGVTLFAAAQEIENRLDPALVKQVLRPPREADAMEEALGLLDQIGQLLSEDELQALEKQLTTDALAVKMRENYLRLLKPEGMFYQPIVRQDPLGISSIALGRLAELAGGMSYRVEVRQGRFVHEDGRQLMMVLETTSSATSLDGSAALTEHLYDLAAHPPKGVIVTPLAGQIHTASNHSMMHWDMQRAGLINAIAFLLMFLLVVQRDWRVLAVFILPMLTVAVTVGICALFYPTLSLVVIGMTSTMVGSAVDYGIFVYIARCLNRSDDPVADMKRVRRTLLTTHMMALGVFASFFFSDIPAYRQLGLLTTISLVLSLLASLYVLPLMLSAKLKARRLPEVMDMRDWGRRTWPVTAAVLVLIPVMGYLAWGVGFDSDLSRFDGITEEVRQNEKDFHETWSRSETEMAMMVVTGDSRDQAESLNDQLYRPVMEQLSQGSLVSLTRFWPSAGTRQANEARWRAFWTDQRIASLKADLKTAGEPYGFSQKAFDPFFQTLENPSPASSPKVILDALDEQFIARAGNRWQVISYFEDTPENVKAVRALIADEPDALVVSRMAINQTFITAALSEVRVLMGISVAFILLAMLAMTRWSVKGLLVILPAILGLLTMLAVMALLQLPINVVTIVAAIVVLAVSIDYGVFTRHAWEGQETLFGQGMAAVHLSAWITLAATGSLLIADHPAMYVVGVSLTVGLGAGYFTCVLVLPGLYHLLGRLKQGETHHA